MSAPQLLLDLRDGALTATLNRPEAHNALGEELVAALEAAMDRAERDPAVRLLCLRAEGRSFCGGVDLRRASAAAAATEAEGIADALRLTGMMLRLSRLAKPTLALVQGPAYGAGIGLVIGCDIVLAAPAVHFALTQVRHGLVPGFVAPFLAHAIGSRAARRYLMTGERFDAAEAQRLGLVHEVVADAAIEARAAAIIADLARGGPESLAGTKRMLDAFGPVAMDDAQLRGVAEAVALHRRSAEAHEGMSAFKEKRRPAWCADTP